MGPGKAAFAAVRHPLRLAPLGYEGVAQFYAGHQHYGLAETLMVYGILGGTPRCHALINPSQPMAQGGVDTRLRPQSPLEDEARFLLGSRQIRGPAPYNAILGAIASGTLRYGEILDATGVEQGSFARYLRGLTGLGWIRRGLPFGETSDRRALYRAIAPLLPDYIGWHLFEEICPQWLQRHARAWLGLAIPEMGRYWSRDGQVEIDVMAKTEGDSHLYGECKWSGDYPVGLGVYSALQGKVTRLLHKGTQPAPAFVLFSTGGFASELEAIAANAENRLHLVGLADFLPSAGDIP